MVPALGSAIPQPHDPVAVEPLESVVPAPRVAPATPWLAWLIGLTAGVAAVGLWAALLAQEEARFAHAAAMRLETVRNQIVARMESRVLAQVRMARRWEMRGQPPRGEWESDADQYMRHYAGLLDVARLDSLLEVQWARGAGGTDDTLASSSAATQSIAHGRRQIALTSVFSHAIGGKAFAVVVPIFRGDAFDGMIMTVHGVRALLDDILGNDIAPGYGIRVMDGRETIYLRGDIADDVEPRFHQNAGVRLLNAEWRVDVWPLAKTLSAAHTPLPRAVLSGGLTLALLLAVATRMAQLARLRAIETESAIRRLQREVAARQRTQERLRKLSSAVEQSPTMVLITDVAGAIEYVNPRFTQVTGYALDEVRGRNPRLLKSGCTPPATHAQLWRTIAAGGEWRGELCNRKKNGESYWEHIAISPIRDEQDRLTHFLAEAEDITERKRLQEEVSARNRESAENRALAVMGQAATMIAHDLRNPLSTVKMSLGILGKHAGKDLSDTEQEINRLALDQVRYMEEVLSELLSFSRPDALQPTWLSIDKVLDTAVLLVQREIDEHKARVDTGHAPGLPTLHGDANKLRQAFSNLILNAVQACEGIAGRTPEVHVLTRVQLGRQSPEICVEIADNGCGIPERFGERVFEPFFTSRARGTGLGLPIARRIIEQHRGRIELRSEPGGGTCVVVTLPTGPVSDAP